MSTIRICRHPFESREAHVLVRGLEADLAAFYPDWGQLNHPNQKPNPRPATPPTGEIGPNVLRGESSELTHSGLTSVEDCESTRTGLFFFVAFDGTLPVGCVALRLLSAISACPDYVPPPLPEALSPSISYAEIKRMFVSPSHRGRGLSNQILAHVEEYARDVLGIDSMVLEVGLRQHAAVSLYRSAGYLERPMYGEYQGMSVAEGGDSICMEKVFQLRHTQLTNSDEK